VPFRFDSATEAASAVRWTGVSASLGLAAVGKEQPAATMTIRTIKITRPGKRDEIKVGDIKPVPLFVITRLQAGTNGCERCGRCEGCEGCERCQFIEGVEAEGTRTTFTIS
jgi:hypothetical protein